ncbi:MAG: glycoside hydrolase family protein [Verrucomicrobiales bacterium]|nr:glycoside hydrolase family protein [Verrucomicrobiales bacterium]
MKKSPLPLPRRSTFFVVLAALLLIGHLMAGLLVVAYVPNWVDLKSFSETIDYGKLTHINVAFENPVNDAGNLSFSSRNEVLITKARAQGVKVLISIGGGAASDNKALKARYFDLLSDGKRAGFAAKIADYITAHQFDGLDVDIEGPSINQDYDAFIDELAKVLKPRGKLLTAALSKGYGGDRIPSSALAQFDFVTIMAYDGAGYWSPERPGQHSSLDFAKENTAYWLQRGLAREKAVLGVPFYGYGFGDAFKKRDYPYNKIIADHPGAENADQTGSTIWYNGIPTIRTKAQYVLEEKLAGVMIWSLDYDVKGEKSLLDTIHRTLHPAEKEKAAPAKTP